MSGVELIAGKRSSRVITALILLPLAVGSIYLSQPYSAILFFIAGAWGVYEWAGLARWVSAWQRGGFIGAYALLAALSYGMSELQLAGLWLGVVIWAFAITGILIWPTGRGVFKARWLVAPLGVLVVWSAWVALLAIRAEPHGSHWLLWVFALIWGVDIGAYFVGKRFGRRRLAPSLSPGKTWEGALGGAAAAAAACLGALAVVDLLDWVWVGLTLLLIVVSIFGDLLESLLKRESGVKDSGALLPGHGGVLDRIDSTLPVLPVIALVLTGF